MLLRWFPGLVPAPSLCLGQNKPGLSPAPAETHDRASLVPGVGQNEHVARYNSPCSCTAAGTDPAAPRNGAAFSLRIGSRAGIHSKQPLPGRESRLCGSAPAQPQRGNRQSSLWLRLCQEGGFMLLFAVASCLGLPGTVPLPQSRSRQGWECRDAGRIKPARSPRNSGAGRRHLGAPAVETAGFSG